MSTINEKVSEALGIHKPELPDWAEHEVGQIFVNGPIAYEGWRIATNGYDNGDAPILIPQPFSTNLDTILDALALRKIEVVMTHAPGHGNSCTVVYDDRVGIYEWTKKSMAYCVCRAFLDLVEQWETGDDEEPWIAGTMEDGTKIARPLGWNPIERS